MRNSLRFFITAAAFAAFSWASAARGIDPPRPGTAFFHTERISQRGSFFDVERGAIFLPLNRSRPESGVIMIEVYRFLSKKLQSEVPPVFLLHGGPGFRGLGEEDLRDPRFYERHVRPFTEIIGTDLVVVGQRGIGSSKPDTLIEPIEFLSPDEELTPERYAEAVRAACESGKKFWESRSLDLGGFTVIEAAADVNDVRNVLGYDRIILSGGSFGSHWGMAVMRFHPEIVARAVLSSLEGPDHTWDMPGHVLNSVERIAAAAEQDPGLKEHIPEGGLIAAFREVIERLEKEPVTLEGIRHPVTGKTLTVRLDGDGIRRTALGVSGRINSRNGMPAWPADIIEMHRGNFQKAARAYLLDIMPRRWTASYFCLDCGSGISRDRKKQLDADPAVAVLGDRNALYRAATPIWAEADPGDEFRENFDTEIPTLLVHGTWDVSTPLENAEELAPHFKNGKLVPVEGGSHGAFGEAVGHSKAFRDAWMAFIRTGDLSEMPDEVTLPPIRWKIPD